MDNMFSQYYQQTTYKNDYKKSPRGQPTYGDSSPRGGYYSDAPRGDQRHFREAPREHIDRRYEEGPPRQQIQPGETLFVEPNRSPHHSPRSPRRGYDGFSPAPAGPPINPRGYQYYDRSREDLPPFNTYAINSTTQHDYGDFTQKQQIVNDIRARADAELARRYEKQYDGRPYFDEKDPPSFYRDLPLTDRPGYDMGRRAPKYDDGPLTDRSERNRRPPSLDHRSPPPPPRNAFEDMSRGQMKKELDRIELHDGNFKPYSHHNSGGGEEGNAHVENDVSQKKYNECDMAEIPWQLFMPYHMQNIQPHHDNPRPVAHHQRLYEQPAQRNSQHSVSPAASNGSKELQMVSGHIAHHKRLYERPPTKPANDDGVKSEVVENKGPGVLSRSIPHHEHRYEDDLMKTSSPRRSQDPGVLMRPIENHEHRFENNLVETNNPRRSTDPGILPRQVEHSEHRYENNIIETNYPRQNKIMHRKEDDTLSEGLFYPDALLRPEEKRVKQKLPMHDIHRFEQVHKTDNPERIYAASMQDVEGAGVGVFLLIRTDYGGYDDVKKAFERCSGETPERKLLGYASSDMIDVKEGGNGWKRQSLVSRWNGKNLEQERRGDVDKMMVINWFQGPNQAREWVDRNPEFKHSHLPMPYGNQTSVLPLKYRPSSGYRTFMLMEFNNISKRNMQELHGYIDFMCNELKRYRADVAFIDTAPKTLKSSLFSPSSHILCHMFCDRKEADRFFNDVISRSRFKHADVTTMVFQLVDFD
ncbi:uncharacterized protein LOC117337344 isoform X4 [Pecten maximus]|uniref:uncharacterized protein LOC117337344 isoform X4 n=1 Tax=Pecten maximus TaxID=6579 RepID=UPI001458FA40|nr:uncharacterized protein LOC117337344 isoform X4 [Pecten maximus]